MAAILERFEVSQFSVIFGPNSLKDSSVIFENDKKRFSEYSKFSKLFSLGIETTLKI